MCGARVHRDRDTRGRGDLGFLRKVIQAQRSLLSFFPPVRFCILCHTEDAGGRGLATARSRSQEGDIYLEHSRINDEKLCLRDKMMKGKSGPVSSAPRVQRWSQEQGGLSGLGKQCRVCAHGPPGPSGFDLECVQTRMYGPLTFEAYQGNAFPPLPPKLAPPPHVLSFSHAPSAPAGPSPACSPAR